MGSQIPKYNYCIEYLDVCHSHLMSAYNILYELGYYRADTIMELANNIADEMDYLDKLIDKIENERGN